MKKRHILSLLVLLILCAPAAQARAEASTTMKESVVAAVKQHPQVKALLHNRNAMSKNLTSSLGRFFPSLDLTSNLGFQEYNSSTTRNNGNEDRTRTATDTTLQLTQNVFDGMDRYNDYQGSKARLDSAEYRLINNVETIALDAIRAHIDMVRERLLVDLAQQNVTDHQEVLESITERVAGGAGSLADEMQARGRVARAESTLIAYNGDLQTAEAQYLRIVGNIPGTLVPAEDKPELAPADRDAVLNAAADNNPEIKIFKAEIEAAERDRGVTQSELYPNVDIELSSRHTDRLDGSETFLQDNRAMLAVSWNLFNGGSDYMDTGAANDRISEAQEELRDTQEELTREVLTAWAEYQTALGQIDKYTEALQFSIESRDMYMAQFNVGQRSLLDVLDSINEVFSNSVQLETAKSNKLFSLYKFKTLEGQLIQTLAVDAKTYETASN